MFSVSPKKSELKNTISKSEVFIFLAYKLKKMIKKFTKNEYLQLRKARLIIVEVNKSIPYTKEYLEYKQKLKDFDMFFIDIMDRFKLIYN